MKKKILSDEQLRHLTLIADGMSDQEISEKLKVSYGAICSRYRTLKAVLKADNKANLIYIACKQGYIQ